MASAPGWRNGIRSRLKIGASKGFVGSTPTPGIALIGRKRAGFQHVGLGR
jgi:hypothetical protein